jgi:TolB-like protein/DNA-binding winged helix-turn-helix (wHTH) protein
MDPFVTPRLQFEGFTLDVMRRRLSDGDHDITLRPKSLDVLLYLLDRPGQLATKDEIIQAVWPNVVATDESLARCVSDIRQALGDCEQRIIQTIPGRGYIFAAPVTVPPADETASSGAIPTRSVARQVHRKRLAAAGPLLLVAAVLLIVAVGAPWRPSAPLLSPDVPSIAVLPFANPSGDASQDHLADGIAEELTIRLSSFGELFVIAANSASRFRGAEADTGRIGRELGARYLPLGTVRRDAERIRVSAQLVEADGGRQIWAARYDGELQGLFAVQDEIVQQIAARLVVSIQRSELDRAMRKPPGAWTAYDHYLRGNALMKAAPRDRSGAALAGARTAYEEALAADSRYAPAVLGLAATHVMEWLNPQLSAFVYRPHNALDYRALDRAAELAQQAIELDPTLAEAYATLGWILHWRVGPEAGLPVFERAFQLNPNLADGRFANLLSHAGRAPEAIEFMQRTMRADPFYPPVYEYFLGKSYFYAGRYEEALGPIRAVADRLPALRPVLPVHAAAAALTGHEEEARVVATKLLEAQPDFTISGFLSVIRLARKEDHDRLAQGLRLAGLPE